METLEVEGLIIQTQPYQDRLMIGQLFTKEGLLNFIYTTKKNLPSLTPLTLGCFILRKKSSSHFYKVTDSYIVDHFLQIRSSLQQLQAAGSILHALKTTQLSEKPSPSLFSLTKLYLSQLKKTTNPHVLEASFFMKLLKHEGLLNDQKICYKCQVPRIDFIESGRLLCQLCAPQKALSFKEEEFQTFLCLCHSQSFQELERLTLSQELHKKIKDIYKYSEKF